MNLIVSALSKVSMNKIAVWINVCVDDWTAERAIIASNELFNTWPVVSSSFEVSPFKVDEFDEKLPLHTK